MDGACRGKLRRSLMECSGQASDWIRHPLSMHPEAVAGWLATADRRCLHAFVSYERVRAVIAFLPN